MDLILLIVLGLALSIDTLTISLIISLTTKKLKFEELRIPIVFGITHSIMIIIGYFFSTIISNTIQSIDHWIGFFLLMFLGIKMIREGEKKRQKINWGSKKYLAIITMATSIDALAIGITISVLEQNPFISSAVIGIIVILMSYIGLFTGKQITFLKPKYTYPLGGIILVIIGIKILVEHLLL